MRIASRSSRPLAALVVASLVVASLLVPRPAVAAANDVAASTLRQEAIYQDYLVTRFDEARIKLLKALSLCAGAPDCTSATRAHLHCNLGVIDFAQGKPDDGHAEFAEAVKQDPTVVIDHDLSTPVLEKAFAGAGGHAPAVEPRSPAPDDVKGSAARQSTDCPPGFPGCDAPEKSEADKTDGATEEAEATPRADTSFKRSWVSVGFQVDALLLPTASNACAGGSGYTCFDGGSYYVAKPVVGADDVVNGGIRVATKRILFGYDYALGGNLTVGGRLGVAFAGGPTRPGGRGFDPVHVEARASYWFGHDPLGRAGVRFFVNGAIGFAEVDATVPADVYATVAAYQAGQSQNYDAWRKTGLGFGSLGLGGMYAFTSDSGVVLEAKVLEMFPTNGTALAFQLGYAIGI